jgi:hypothetical protein
MNKIERGFIRQSPDQRRSVLDGSKYIGGFLSDKKSSVEEARTHPDEVRACKSALDGPACIAGVFITRGSRLS